MHIDIFQLCTFAFLLNRSWGLNSNKVLHKIRWKKELLNMFEGSIKFVAFIFYVKLLKWNKFYTIFSFFWIVPIFGKCSRWWCHCFKLDGHQIQDTLLPQLDQNRDMFMLCLLLLLSTLSNCIWFKFWFNCSLKTTLLLNKNQRKYPT